MNLPAVQGTVTDWYDGRYRIWTVNEVPFDRFPSYSEGGPATVTITSWGVSTESLCRWMSSPSVVAADDGMVTLNVHRACCAQHIAKHELDGTKYATERDAKRAAYEAGLLGFMLYVKNEAQFDVLEEKEAA